MTAITAAVAALAAACVVGLVALTSEDEQTAGPAPAPTARPGAPPLSLDLGVRTDPESLDLRRAARLYQNGQRDRARELFGRHDSLEARVGESYAAWPDGTVDRLTQLAGLHPGSALVHLNLGTALYWARRPGAEEAWRTAAETEPDTPYAVAAGNLLHPDFARDLPQFVPSFPAPRDLDRLPLPQQLEQLERGSHEGGLRAKLLYGVALQRLGRPRSAQRVFAAAARLAPGNPEAQVAAAVGRFDKAKPAEAFSRLGPLTRRFPRSASVRFHLGLLLLWSGEVKEAKRQLGLARTAEPGSQLAREAARYLQEISRAGA